MWRVANSSDDAAIVEMSLALYAEDPSPLPVGAEQVAQTLVRLRSEPARGRAVVLQANEELAGYAFLISFWSNELGGEVVVVDELYVRPAFRNRGHARELLSALAVRGAELWPGNAVALELEVTPDNSRAAALYSGLGFELAKNRRMRRMLLSPKRCKL